MSADSTALSKHLSDMPSQATAIMNALGGCVSRLECEAQGLWDQPKGGDA